MSVTERQRAALSNHSPKNAQRRAPDPTWKAQQAFIRATRRGSKKHTSMPDKLKLLDAATAAIPAPKKINVLDLQRKRLAEEAAALVREQQATADAQKRNAEIAAGMKNHHDERKAMEAPSHPEKS